MLPKRIADVKSYNGWTKWMYISIKDNDLLEKYNTIWDKVTADINKYIDNEPAYNKNFWKPK